MYVNAKKFASLSGIPYGTVRRLITEGKIPAYKPFGRWFVPLEEAMEAIKQTPLPMVIRSQNFLQELKKI